VTRDGAREPLRAERSVLDLLDLAQSIIVNRRHAIARPKFLALCRGDADRRRAGRELPGFE